MSDEKKADPTAATTDETTETRIVTVTISGRMTRKAGDALLAACATIGDAFASRGVTLAIGAAAPVESAEGTPAEDDGPCPCPGCTIKRAVLAAMTEASASATEASPESRERAQAERDAGVNAIPAKGPWGVS